ncbi:hypothetical protein [Pedobacter nototheniae]|uniref:hypothetical protein n=1 Tax=Pedobacter nototheniae TaxID=2488994 RepID=UPI001038F6F6|nr:hypothetical protein [Pedobacter nototheniae]
MNVRKTVLIIGFIIFFIGLISSFAIDNFLEKYAIDKMILIMTTLIGGVILVLYGATGRYFLKALLFIFCSILFCMGAWTIYEWDNWWSIFVVFYVGTGAGVSSAVLLLIIRYYFFIKKAKKPSLFILIPIYLLLVFVASVVFYCGHDVIFDVFGY